MKKFSKLAIGLVACFTLAACGGSSVSAEKFQEEAKKVEPHQYSSATVKYSLDEDFGMGDALKASGTIEFTYDQESGWTTKANDSNAEECESYLEVNVSTFDASQIDAASYEGVNVNYYINPFKITVKGSSKGTDESTGATSDVKADVSISFDKYGFVTNVKMYMSVKMSVEYMGEKMEMNMHMNDTVTISYK